MIQEAINKSISTIGGLTQSLDKELGQDEVDTSTSSLSNTNLARANKRKQILDQRLEAMSKLKYDRDERINQLGV